MIKPIFRFLTNRFFNPVLLVLFLTFIVFITIVITILSYLNANIVFSSNFKGSFYAFIFLSLILLYISSLLAIIFVLFIIILDKRYRLSVSQYPYNYYLDRLFPLIALFCPSISVLLFCPSTVSLLQRFTILLLIHCFILIPLFYCWSGLREWNLLASSLSFNHPQVFFQIALAVIYPAIWGIYFSTIRYIRMGVTIDFSVYLQLIDPEIFIIICFIFYYFFPLFISIASMLNMLRTYLWDHTASLLYSVHLVLLRYFVYFRICEIIYKAHFLYHDILSGSVGATTWDLKDVPFYRRVISYIYYHSFILTVLLFISILIELLLTKGKLHYGIYSLFVYLIIFGFFRCFSAFGFTDFVKDVCLCDYNNHNFISPRYPIRFWYYLANAQKHFGYEQHFHPDLVDVLGRLVIVQQVQLSSLIKRRKWQLLFRIWNRDTVLTIGKRPLITTIIKGYPKRWSLRVAAAYLSSHGVRWFHNTRVMYSPLPEKLHPLTVYFVKTNPYAMEHHNNDSTSQNGNNTIVVNIIERLAQQYHIRLDKLYTNNCETLTLTIQVNHRLKIHNVPGEYCR